MNDNLKRQPPVASWGDRRALLAKRMAYAMSFDVELRVEAAGTKLALLSASASASAKEGGRTIGSLYHIFGQSSVVIADTSVREVPESLRVVYGDAELTADIGAEANSIAGSIVFKGEGDMVMSMGYSGTLTSSRGSSNPLGKDARGTVFIATRQDSSVPSLRWLAQRQLFGVGRMTAKGIRSGRADQAEYLEMSFDMYTAA